MTSRLPTIGPKTFLHRSQHRLNTCLFPVPYRGGMLEPVLPSPMPPGSTTAQKTIKPTSATLWGYEVGSRPFQYKCYGATRHPLKGAAACLDCINNAKIMPVFVS